jgi:hypothetical protein
MRWSFVPLISLAEDIEGVLHLCEPRSLAVDVLPTSFGTGLQPAFSRWTLVLAGAFQFLAGLLLALPPLLLLLLPWLLCLNHQFGPDRALRLLEACVLVKVLPGVIDAEPLQWCGLK